MMSQGSPELALKRRPFGSWLLGPADQSTRLLRFRLQVLMTTFSIGTNLIGALVVFVLAVFVLPGPPLLDHLKLFEAIAIPSYFLIAIAVGCIWSTWLTRRVTRWVDEERPATRAEQIATLQLPLRLTLIEVLLWLVAGVIFTVMTFVLQPENALRIAVTVFDGMIITCAVSYLLTEFALRPVAARALVDSPPPRRLLAAGLKARTVFFWAVGSGVPVAGLMLAAVLALIEKDVSSTRLSVVILALGIVALGNGWLLTMLSARSVVAPVRSVRTALCLIGEGRLEHAFGSSLGIGSGPFDYQRLAFRGLAHPGEIDVCPRVEDQRHAAAIGGLAGRREPCALVVDRPQHLRAGTGPVLQIRADRPGGDRGLDRRGDIARPGPVSALKIGTYRAINGAHDRSQRSDSLVPAQPLPVTHAVSPRDAAARGRNRRYAGARQQDRAAGVPCVREYEGPRGVQLPETTRLLDLVHGQNRRASSPASLADLRHHYGPGNEQAHCGPPAR